MAGCSGPVATPIPSAALAGTVRSMLDHRWGSLRDPQPVFRYSILDTAMMGLEAGHALALWGHHAFADGRTMGALCEAILNDIEQVEPCVPHISVPPAPIDTYLPPLTVGDALELSSANGGRPHFGRGRRGVTDVTSVAVRLAAAERFTVWQGYARRIEAGLSALVSATAYRHLQQLGQACTGHAAIMVDTRPLLNLPLDPATHGSFQSAIRAAAQFDESIEAVARRIHGCLRAQLARKTPIRAVRVQPAALGMARRGLRFSDVLTSVVGSWGPARESSKLAFGISGAMASGTGNGLGIFLGMCGEAMYLVVCADPLYYPQDLVDHLSQAIFESIDARADGGTVRYSV